MKSHAGHRRRQMTTVNTLATTVFLLLITTTSLIVAAVKSPSSDHCDPTSQPAPQTLRSDQITVLINGYSESRIPLLKQISSVYSNSPLVASVIILWGNPETPSETVTHLSHNLSLPILQQPSPSLNNRFLPRPKLIATRAVLIADDDVLVDVKTIEFAFRVWGLNKDRLVGLFVRSHDVDLSTRAWMYTVHDHKYSIVLTKFMMMKVEYLYSYSCEGGEAMAEARRVVEEARNCEDILMNFVAAEAAGVGPVLVGAERVRDWGDPRNDGSRREGVREVGLSSRRGDHRKRRGECIREFHLRLGRMPLRYSYGKVVNSVGEQGLCDKGGKLVLCDKQV